MDIHVLAVIDAKLKAGDWLTTEEVKGRTLAENGLKWLLATADYEVTQVCPKYSAGMARATLVFDGQFKLEVMMDGDRVVSQLNNGLWAFKEDFRLNDGFWMMPH